MDDTWDLFYRRRDRAVGPSNLGREQNIHRPAIEIALGETSRIATSSRPEPISDQDDVKHYGIWLQVDYSNSLQTVTICKHWRKSVINLDYYRVAEELYAFPADYWFVIPDKGAKVTECPAGHAHCCLCASLGGLFAFPFRSNFGQDLEGI